MFSSFLIDYEQKGKSYIAAVDVNINEKDYQSTIIKSLPNLLTNFTSSQLTTAQLFSTSKTVEPDVLISVIAKEANCQKAKYPAHGDAKDRDCEEVMAIAHEGLSQG